MWTRRPRVRTADIAKNRRMRLFIVDGAAIYPTDYQVYGFVSRVPSSAPLLGNQMAIFARYGVIYATYGMLKRVVLHFV